MSAAIAGAPPRGHLNIDEAATEVQKLIIGRDVLKSD
jgi:hypothetical protein